MKAYLMEVSLTTRILMPDDFDLDEFFKSGARAGDVVALAEPRFIEKIRTELMDNLVELEEDLEVPYDPEHDGDKFCETCEFYMKHVIEDKVNRYCKESGETLSSSQWQGCPKHKHRNREK